MCVVSKLNSATFPKCKSLPIWKSTRPTCNIIEGILCRDFKESETFISLCISFQKPTRNELPVDIEPVSEIVTEHVTEKLDEVSPVIEDTIRNYDFE